MRGTAVHAICEPQGGRVQAAAGGEGVSSLTDRVRALYEGSVVPVREIAAVAGVTERTLYKYVAKGGWRRRYAGAWRCGRCGEPRAWPYGCAGICAGQRARAGASSPARMRASRMRAGSRRSIRLARGRRRSAVSARLRAPRMRLPPQLAAAARRRDVRRAESELRAFALLNAALVDLVRMQGEAGGAGTPRAKRVAARLMAVILRQMKALAGNHGEARGLNAARRGARAEFHIFAKVPCDLGSKSVNVQQARRQPIRNQSHRTVRAARRTGSRGERTLHAAILDDARRVRRRMRCDRAGVHDARRDAGRARRRSRRSRNFCAAP